MRCLGLYTALVPVDSARYDSRYAAPGCLEGTRISVLSRLREWVRSPSAFSVFWLSGTAGTGKTTIAKTFCDEIARAGFMVASFFISRQDEARQDPGNIVRSLAYDLATHDWSRAQAIWNELNSIPHLLSRDIPEQVTRLLSKPSGLEHIDDFPIIIIIDALDESTESDHDHDRGNHLIPLLVSALKHQVIRIFVTSRNEEYISNYMAGMEHDALRLHHMERSDTSKDVRSFYETRFCQLVQSRNLRRMNWPSPADIDVLIDRTGHLFVYASTIMAFVSDPREDPEHQLALVLNQTHEPIQGDNGVFEQLDKLYTQIILAAVTQSGAINPRRRDRVRMLIGLVIVLQRPLRFTSIVDMVMSHNRNYSEKALRTDLEALSSVIPVPQTDIDPVQIYHPSFRDFIQDSNRCKGHSLHIPSSEASLSVAIACLRLVNKGLYRDMCETKDPTVMNRDIYDLRERLDHFVPESLRYACIHWTSHVVSALVTSPLIKELKEFCQKNLFHWIELLSLLGNLSAAAYGLRRVLDWCRVSPCQPIVVYIVLKSTD
jgi:hypothetical protein